MTLVIPNHNTSLAAPEAVRLAAAPTINDTVPDIRKYAKPEIDARPRFTSLDPAARPRR
jgi:hypothetical protein